MKDINISDIMSSPLMYEQIEMIKRNELLKLHHKWQGKDGKWRTYIEDEFGERKLVKRSKEEDIDDVIVNFYEKKQEQKDAIPFNVMFKKWFDVHCEGLNPNTSLMYEAMYKNHIKGTKFEKIDITNVTSEEIKSFLIRIAKNDNVGETVYKIMWLIKATLKFAMNKKLISYNPANEISKKDISKYISTNCKKKPETRIVTEEEYDIICNAINDYLSKEKHVPCCYAILLASETGLRVGELCGLEWKHIHDGIIEISQSEKFNQRTREFYISDTKNKKHRNFPITNRIQDILNNLKKYQDSHMTKVPKFLLEDENKKYNTYTVINFLEKICLKNNIPNKGIHSFRRTFNSKLKHCGVSTKVAADLLGHTVEVNERWYTYDLMSDDDKKNLLEDVNRKLSDMKYYR